MTNPIFWTITTENGPEGWTWNAHGCTEAGDEFEDDSAGQASDTAPFRQKIRQCGIFCLCIIRHCRIFFL